MSKNKKVLDEELDSTEEYESFDEDLDAALSDDALDGISGADEDDFNAKMVLGFDMGGGSEGF